MGIYAKACTIGSPLIPDGILFCSGFFKMAMISVIACWMASLLEKEGIGMVWGRSFTVFASTSATVSGIKHLMQW
eukprot:3969310-Ditylum_brightwellii.AAC.2